MQKPWSEIKVGNTIKTGVNEHVVLEVGASGKTFLMSMPIYQKNGNTTATGHQWVHVEEAERFGWTLHGEPEKCEHQMMIVPKCFDCGEMVDLISIAADKGWEIARSEAKKAIDAQRIKMSGRRGNFSNLYVAGYVSALNDVEESLTPPTP